MEIINEFGPTETTVGATTNSLQTLSLKDNGKGNITIGKPMGNVEIYIITDGQLTPIGIIGEIWIGGIQVARGYLNNQHLTSDKFITNTFNRSSPYPLYKTGDLGRWLADGTIEYFGRKDGQIKINGYRIEAGEIENVLIESGLIDQAVVLVRVDNKSYKSLVGFVVTKDGQFDKEGIVAYLKMKLPQYMIPYYFIEVSEIPLTPNGKIDKKRLLMGLVDEQFTEGDRFSYPITSTENLLVEIWQELLARKNISVNESFFEAGGNSLQIVNMVEAIRKKLSKQIGVVDAFRYPSITLLANFLDSLEFEFKSKDDPDGSNVTTK